MCETSSEDQEKPAFYEVRIKGHLDARWVETFEGLTITLEEDGNTRLIGPGIDEAALHRLLRNVRDFGMTLLSVNLKKENSHE
jgi:hypothetical protein